MKNPDSQQESPIRWVLPPTETLYRGCTLCGQPLCGQKLATLRLWPTFSQKKILLAKNVKWPTFFFRSVTFVFRISKRQKMFQRVLCHSFLSRKVIKWPTMTLNDVIIGRKSSKLAKDISAGNFRTNGINIRYKRDKSFQNKQITRTNLQKSCFWRSQLEIGYLWCFLTKT